MALTPTEEKYIKELIEAYQNGKSISELPALTNVDGKNLLIEVLDVADGESKKAVLEVLASTVSDSIIKEIDTKAVAAQKSADEAKALAQTKQDKLVSGENIKTICGVSLLGEGNLLMEDLLAYGVEIDLDSSSPNLMRIGNMTYHKSLPIQSMMRGCLLNDNGVVVEYLPNGSWLNSTRDGSKGMVMVEIPKHYRKCVTKERKCQIWLSMYPLAGYHVVPKMYVSAYEAAMEHSTGKLCSVVNMDADYRGGTNEASWDGTFRTLLGRPITGISIINFRKAARKRGSTEWNLYLYDVHKAIFWLFCVEYGILDFRSAYTAELTPEGYHKGGLGPGVTDVDPAFWDTFNNSRPFVPCGHTDSLGNQTGVVKYTIKGESEEQLKVVDVNRYRGIENPFGHIWKISDGINLRISAAPDHGGDGLSKVFVCSAPAKFSDTDFGSYKHVGNAAANNGYVGEVILGEECEIIPSVITDGSSKSFRGYFYTKKPDISEKSYVLEFGGTASLGIRASFLSTFIFSDTHGANATSGSRLCFLPNN